MRDLKRLRRSTTDRRIAGVAGGIGRHLDVDPTVIRVLLVVLVFFGGAGLLLYGALWLFVPEDGRDDAPISTTGETRTVVLLAVGVLAGLLLLGDTWWLGFGGGWPPPVVPLLAVGLVAWLLLRNRGDGRGGAVAPGTSPTGAAPASATDDAAGDPTGDATGEAAGYAPSPAYAVPAWPAAGPPVYPPPPAVPRERRPRSLFGPTMALVALALGVVAVVDLAGTALPWAVYPAAALTVIGLALLVGSFAGRTTGLVLTGLVAGSVLAVAVWAPDLRIGDLAARPATAAALQEEYAYTVGQVHLDLTGIEDLEALDGRVVDISMRAGEVVVDVPEGLDVDVSSTADAGRLDVLDRVVEGPDIANNRSTADTAAPDLRLDIAMGFGRVEVSTR
jgi:phage shock protein PspC (stress-responsive transcriptional regulator)